MFLIGGILALVVRAELAQPGLQFVKEDVYNQAFTIHASLMLFLFIIPILAGFGNYVVPLQIGAPDMAFPRINALSFWMLPLAGDPDPVRVPGRRRRGDRLDRATPRCRRRKYSGVGQDLWIVGVILIGTSSILGGINFLVTIFKMRAPGMTMFRLPIMVWTMLVTSTLVVLATPVLTSAPDHAVHRPQLRRPLLRPGQRRERDPVAERVLVLLAPGGLHHGPAGDGDRQRGPAGLQPQAAVRLQGVRLRDGRRSAPSGSACGPTTCSRPARSTCRSSAS